MYQQWKDLLENQTQETFKAFWKKYSDTEIRIYSHILDQPEEKFSGVIKDLIEKFQADPKLFFGFLDGINSSLRTPLEMESLEMDSEIDLDIDFERLYFNMLNADADHLYGLEQWNQVLGQEKIESITKDYRKSKTVVKEKKIGRNEPCPCGSGKKYKHCCGKS